MATPKRFKVLSHKGESILRLDFSKCSHREAWDLILHFDAWIARQAPDSARIILELRQVSYDPVLIMHCRIKLESYRAAVRKCAVLNASPFSLWLMRHGSQIGLFSRGLKWGPGGRECKSAKEARAWLVEP